MSIFVKSTRLLLILLLLLILTASANCANTVSVLTCKHYKQFKAFLDKIPYEYTYVGGQHWTVIEYEPKLWPYACKVFKATGDPNTFIGVTFPTQHIIIVEDTASVLNTFAHELGHAILWPALTNMNFPEYQKETDAVFQHEYDVLGRDKIHSDQEVQENWCNELAEYLTNDPKTSDWAKNYFSQVFSQKGPFPPSIPNTMPVPQPETGDHQ